MTCGLDLSKFLFCLLYVLLKGFSMDRNELPLLLSAWGRISRERAEMATAHLPEGRVSPDGLGDVLAALHGLALGMDAEHARTLGGMSLETSMSDTDPLEGAEPAALSALLGITLGANSVNGYVNFAETWGRALARTRVNGAVGLTGARVEMHGDEAVGVVTSRTDDENFEFRFTRMGRSVRREGMVRRCEFPAEALRGLGHLLDATKTLEAAVVAMRPIGVPARKAAMRTSALKRTPKNR